MLAICTTGACNKYLDKMPDDRILIDTEAKVYQLLGSAYPKSSGVLIAELSSDNIQHNGYYRSITTSSLTEDIESWSEIGSYNNADDPTWLWDYCYRAIATANKALESIRELGNTPTLAPARGEALLARAYGHFVLANIFCEPYRASSSDTDMGIPYSLSPETKFVVRYPRGTVAELYQRIEKDLLEGMALLDDKVYNRETIKFHFTKRAAAAFAARFYLYYGKWAEAEQYATQVLGTGDPTSMLRDWKIFNTLPRADENAYTQEYVRSDSPANLLLIAATSYSYNYLGKMSNSASRFSHGSRVSDRETLRTTNIWGYYNSGEQDPYHLVPFTNSSRQYNVVLMPKIPYVKINAGSTIYVPFTTEETLLVRAEARILQQKYDEAVQDMNYWTANFINPGVASKPRKTTWTKSQIVSFYEAIPYSEGINTTMKKRLTPDFPVQSGEQEQLLHHLLQCRRILTLHEGLRWYDVRRYGIVVDRHRQEEDGSYSLYATLPFPDHKRTIQLPPEVRGAGMKANPR